MNASVCSRLPELLARRDGDRLPVPEARLLREHLASCDECANEALRHDPVLLLSRGATAAEPLGEAERERFVADVLAAAGAVRARRRILPGRSPALLRVAASLLLAACLAGAWLVRGRVGPSGSVEAPSVVAAQPRAVPPDAVPAVEALGGVGAVVYEFPASAPGEATVVFVVDRNADI